MERVINIHTIKPNQLFKLTTDNPTSTISINWGDGNVDQIDNDQSFIYHIFKSINSYQITISGDCDSVEYFEDFNDRFQLTSKYLSNIHQCDYKTNSININEYHIIELVKNSKFNQLNKFFNFDNIEYNLKCNESFPQEYILSRFDTGLTFDVTGNVYDKITNIPLPNTNIQLKKSDVVIYNIMTDNTGFYKLDDVLLGTYVVSVNVDDYITFEEILTVSQSTVKNIPMTRKYCSVSGKVFDELNNSEIYDCNVVINDQQTIITASDDSYWKFDNLLNQNTYQISTFKDGYVQSDRSTITVQFSKPGEDLTNMNLYLRTYGFKGIESNKLYRYRIITDWDRSLYTSGHIDILPYAPTYKVDGHYITEIQYVDGVFKEVVVESSKTDNPGFSLKIGDVINTYTTPIITTRGGDLQSDCYAYWSGHESVILTNKLGPDYGMSTLTSEQITNASRGTR